MLHDPVLLVIGAAVGLISTIVNGLLFRHLRRVDAMEEEREKKLQSEISKNRADLNQHRDDIFAIQLWIRVVAREYRFPDLYDKD